MRQASGVLALSFPSVSPIGPPGISRMPRMGAPGFGERRIRLSRRRGAVRRRRFACAPMGSKREGACVHLPEPARGARAVITRRYRLGFVYLPRLRLISIAFASPSAAPVAAGVAIPGNTPSGGALPRQTADAHPEFPTGSTIDDHLRTTSAEIGDYGAPIRRNGPLRRTPPATERIDRCASVGSSRFAPALRSEAIIQSERGDSPTMLILAASGRLCGWVVRWGG